MSLPTKEISSVNLNADTLDGKHNGEVTALNATILSPTLIMSGDLNDIRPIGVRYYYAFGNHTCTNIPPGLRGFHLMAKCREGGYGEQELTHETNGDVYRRLLWNNNWGEWRKVTMTTL